MWQLFAFNQNRSMIDVRIGIGFFREKQLNWYSLSHRMRFYKRWNCIEMRKKNIYIPTIHFIIVNENCEIITLFQFNTISIQFNSRNCICFWRKICLLCDCEKRIYFYFLITPSGCYRVDTELHTIGYGMAHQRKPTTLYKCIQHLLRFYDVVFHAPYKLLLHFRFSLGFFFPLNC